MKKVFVLIVISLAMFITSVNAQENVRRKLAEDLLTLTKVKENIEKSFDMVRQMQMEQLGDLSNSDMESEKDASLQGKIMDVIAEEMSWENLKEDYTELYAETFTKEELEGIIAFYKTSIGKKFIEKQPELMQKSMQISQKQMRTLMPKMEEFRQEIMKSSEEQ
ncbi:MAG: hypothetical protein DRP78_04710 [Candidatus Omnitrophota bacterium]|nr:MAG: hypothetical protein DRP78_04710 [Candidatus Omnitrophota bacterium]